MDGAEKAVDNLEKLNQKTKEAENTTNKAESTARKYNDALGSLSMSALAAAAGMTSILTAAKGLVNTISNSIQTFAHFEQIQNSLSGVLRSAEKGKEMFEDLRAFSFDTTFGVDTLSSAAQQLLSVGVESDDLKTKLKQLGDIAGGDTTKFNELVSIFTKIQNTGKAGADQLEMLALRGVPIYQVLEEIGVQGTATADDISKAFEQMTSESGIFYNNMESINNTISGKEGFVSDTFREMGASFAEASGLADVYKASLDVVYNAVQGIVDILQKINANPIAKAIFQGTLVAALGALASVIAIGIVSALKETVVHLLKIEALQMAINPAKAAIGIAAAVGGIVVLNGVLNQTSDKLDENAEKLEQLRKERETLNNMGADTSYIDAQITALDKAIDKTKELKTNLVKTNAENIKRQLDDIRSDIQDYLDGFDDLDTAERQQYLQEDEVFQKLVEQEKVLAEQKTLYDNLVANDEYRQSLAEGRVKQIEAERDAYKSMSEDIDKAYANTAQGKAEELENKIKKYQNYLAKIENNTNIRTDFAGAESREEEIAKIKAILEELTKSGDKSSKTAKTVARNWRDAFTEITGTTVNDKDENGRYKVKNGGEAADRYIKETTENLTRLLETADALNKSAGIQIDVDIVGNYEERMQKIQDALTALQNSKDFDFNWNDASVKKLVEEFTKLQKLSFEGQVKQIEEEEKNLSKTNIQLKVEQLMKEKNLTLEQATQLFNNQTELNYDKQLKSLNDEYELLKLSTEEMQKQLLLQEGMSEEQASSIIYAQKRNNAQSEVQSAQSSYDNATSFADKLSSAITLAQKKVNAAQINQNQAGVLQKSAENKMLEALRVFGVGSMEFVDATQTYNSATDKYNKATEELEKAQKELDINQIEDALESGLSSLVSGTDVGNFVQGVEQSNGNVLVGLINMLIGAISNVISEIDGADTALSPITLLLKEFTPLIKTLLIPAMLVAAAFKQLGEWIMNFLDWITGGAFSDAEDMYDGMAEAMGETTSATEDAADSMRELSDSLKSMYEAVQEQEEYYLKEKTLLNAGTAKSNVTGVNDMILTPDGNFSTDPNDYIIASKNPSALGGSGGNTYLNVVINNNAGDTQVSTEESTNADGMKELIVTISKKVASDVASGANGWDSAMSARETRLKGRRVSL